MTIWKWQYLRSSAVLTAVVFLLGLCLAVAAAVWRQHAIDLDAQTRFRQSVERLSADVVRRFRQPVYGLNGAKGLYAAGERVSRAQFLAYVESLGMRSEFPGVRGFGFIERVTRSELDAWIAAARADGAPQFAVHRFADTVREDLYVVKFIEPASDNLAAQGLDIGSEPSRRAAATLAVDSGEPTLTAPIALVQDDRKTPGVLLYVPVYANSGRPATPEQRRASLVGLLYAPIVIAEMLRGMPDVGPGGVDFELFDRVPGESGSGRLYGTQKTVSTHRFSASQTISLPGKSLTLQVTSTPGFDAAIDRITSWVAFGVGALLSGLLALLVRQQATERHHAELLAQRMTERLRRDEERFRDFSMSASDWFWETDAQHRFCYFSENFEKVYGLHPEQVLGKDRKELLGLNALNSPDMIRAHAAQLEAQLPFKNFEYLIHANDGSTRWIAVSGVPHFDSQGRLAGYRGTGSIITERKNFEAELRLQNERLSALCENFPGAISLFDANLYLVVYNEQFKQLLDFPDSLFEQPDLCFEDIVRYNAARGEYGPGDPEQQVAAIVARARNFQAHSFERVRPNGMALEVRGMPLPGGGFVTVYIDITERKRTEESLRQAMTMAEAANVAKSRFLATMSHEIRTPMNGVLGMAQMLLMPNLQDSERQEFARTILSSGQALLALLNDILDLSKVEAGRLELESSLLEPERIIREIKTLFAESAGNKGLRIETEWVGETDRHYLGDPHRLRQMISNLVGNAIKFTAEGQVRITAREIDRGEDDATLEFAVSDTGIGIPEDKQAALFQPFSQADTSITRQYGGSGLGLSIVRSLARLMGGEVGVTSKAGQGSCFRFRIRAGLVAGGDTRAAETQQTVALHAGASQFSGSVLVAEDTLINRKIMNTLLNKLGLSVAMAEDGQQCVDAIMRGDPADIILMDVQMPVMDGYAATERIRQWEAENNLPRRPIVALTANAFEEDRRHCLTVGMDDFLAKPVVFENLRATLAKWLHAAPIETESQDGART